MAKVKVVKKGGFFGKLVALLLGIIIGIVGGIGGLAFGIYYGISAIKISEILGLVESTGTDVPAEEYVTEEYLDKTILDAILSASGLIGGVVSGDNTFGDLQTVSPYVSTSFEDLSILLNGYGLEITKDELLAMSVPDVGTYLQGQITNIELAGLLALLNTPVDPNNALMCAIMYGEKGVNYTIVEETDGSDPSVVTKTVEMLPLEYVFAENKFTDWKGTEYVLDNENWTNADGSIVIKANPSESTVEDVTISYLYEVYKVEKSEEAGGSPTETLLYKLALKADTTNVYQAYKNDTIVKHKGTTIATLSNVSSLMETLQSMPVGDLLMLSEMENPDPLMLALAYGEDGYYIDSAGLHVTTDTPTTVKELMEGGSALVQDLQIATALNLDMNNASSIDKMQRAIAFGVEGEDYDIVGNAIQMKPGKEPKKIKDLDSDAFGDMKIGDLMNVSGSSKILNLLKDTKIDEISQTIEDLTFGDVIDIPETNPPKIMTFLQGKKITELSGVITDLKLGDVIDVKADSPKILTVLQNKKITELSNAIADLELADVIDGAEDNIILKHLAHEKVTDLGSKIGELNIQQIFCDDVYEKANFSNKCELLYEKEEKYYLDAEYTQEYTGTVYNYFVDAEGKPLYHEPTDSAYYVVTYDSTANSPAISSTTSKPVLTGTWLFLLTTDCTPETEVAYKLTETGSLINNMTKNVQNANLQKLQDSGLITMVDENGKKIDLTQPKSWLGGKSLGEFTIGQLIAILAIME